MRLRIQTYNPLPEIKAWFIPDVQSATSVYDLKEALCLRLQALKARKFGGKDLILLLDDFELLNDSPFSAVRDGDLICVKLSPLAQVEDVQMDIKQPVICESNITRQRKRKRSQSPSLLIPGRSVREPAVLPSLKQKATPPSEEDDSESDTSSTSSCSSSSSTSSSSLSSRSSSLSLPKHLVSQRTQQPIDNVTLPNSASRLIPLVPPGLGKPSTHSRNKRRRLKKDYEKEALLAGTPGPPKGSSLTNNLPLGQRKSKSGPSSHSPSRTNPLLSAKSPTQLSSKSLDASQDNNRTQQNLEGPDSDIAFLNNNTFETNAQDSYSAPNQVMMGSLRNKNKKKGFKQSMANPLPQKIIFTTNTPASSGSQQPSVPAHDMSIDEPSITIPSGTTQPRLIPPSEIQELGQLPSNMFVTSVDVESEMWGEHLPSQKKQGKKKQKTFNEGRYYSAAITDQHDSSQRVIITSENGQFDDAHDDTSLSLPYSDTDVQTATTAQAPSSSSLALGISKPFDWDRLERLWEESAVLEKLEQLVVGCLVGWKALAINPQTFSPEMLLQFAHVVNVDQESAPIASEGTQSIVVRYLHRPGAGRAALAFGLNGRFNDEDQAEEEDGRDDETFEWTDVLTNQWRVINYQL